MIQVSLDTSFLISFADPNREHHAVAVEYFRHCVTQKIPMYVSVVAAGEFAVKQSFQDLPLHHFRIQPYNLPNAILAASFREVVKPALREEADARCIIINDLKILAQAEEEHIPVILSEDESTLSKMAHRLREQQKSSVWVLLLKDGFKPGRLEKPGQDELALGGAASRGGIE